MFVSLLAALHRYIMVNYRTIIVVVTLLTLVSYSKCLKPKKCNNGGPLPLTLVVDGCTEEPCIVYNGIGATMNITFESLSSTKTLEVKVKAFLIGNIAIDFPMPGELGNACNGLLNGYCPIEKGEILIYNLFMPLNYPPTSLSVEFTLLADKQVVFQCFRLRITLRRKPGRNIQQIF